LVESYAKDPTKPVEQCKVVFDYLIGKLAAPFNGERDASSVGLNQLFGVRSTPPNIDFDASLLTQVTHFKELNEDFCLNLAAACALEKRPERIMHYMKFVSGNIGEDSLHRVAPRLSSLVERSNTSSNEHKNIRRSLMDFFADFMRKLIAGGRRKMSSAGQQTASDRMVIQLENNKQVEVDTEIVTAIMELLCESFGDYEVNIQFKDPIGFSRVHQMKTKHANT
jgi:hypothetical protein